MIATNVTSNRVCEQIIDLQQEPEHLINLKAAESGILCGLLIFIRVRWQPGADPIVLQFVRVRCTMPKDTDTRPTDSVKDSRDIALDFLQRFPDAYIFPIRRLEKSPPLTKDNLASGSSNDPAQIELWSKQYPNCNWGVALAKSRMLVVDVDRKVGKHGEDTYLELERQHSPYGFLPAFPTTFTVQTPSGGWHKYYRGKHVFALGEHGFGRDIDSPNYALVPGSETKDGNYSILIHAPVADAPEWFDTLLNQSTGKAVDQIPVVDLDQDANINWAIHFLERDANLSIQGENGERTLLEVAAVLKDAGISEHKAVELLLEHYNDRCSPPWSADPNAPVEDQLAVKVRNAFVYLTQNQPGGATAEATFAADPLPHDTEAHAEAIDPEKIGTINTKAGRLDANARALMKLLLRNNKIKDRPTTEMVFQRGDELVHLNRAVVEPGHSVDEYGFGPDELVIVSASEPWLTGLASRRVDWGKTKKARDGRFYFAVEDPPPRIIKQVLKDTTSWPFPKLDAVLETVTMRPDGTILQEQGYDPKTRLFLDTGGVEFPKVKSKPTIDDAREALALLEDVVCDFPFDDSADDIEGLSRAVALSMMLCAVVRRILPICPGYGIDANEVSSGKTELAQVAACIATGRKTGERRFTNDEEELEKQLIAALWKGASVILFDNVGEATFITGDKLCAAITEEKSTGRILGESREVTVPTNALIIFTGNHLTVAGDMNDRILLAKIVPDRKIKERTFKHGKPLWKHVVKRRPDIVHAVLTLIRAYLDAGEPIVTNRSRFPDWERLCCEPLVWLGLPGPTLAFERAKREDPQLAALRKVMAAWRQMDEWNCGRTTDVLLDFHVTTPRPDAPDIDYLIRDAIADALDKSPHQLTRRAAANWLNSKAGVNVDGWRIKSYLDKDGAKHWWLDELKFEVTDANENDGD